MNERQIAAGANPGMSEPGETGRRLETAVATLRGAFGAAPLVAVIAGTGLGGLAETLAGAVSLDYGAIPGFPRSTVPGHRGRLVCGRLDGHPTLVFQGRFHLYEGYTAAQVTFPLRAAFRWGVRGLVVTNAAGGLNPAHRAGDIMMVTDHINAMGTSPLIGSHDESWGARFPDLSTAYDPELRRLAAARAEALGVRLHQGVYVAVLGPQLETPAETRMYRALGADAIGMSTVPEVIVARQAGVRVLAFSVITNVNNPDDMQPATLPQILAAADQGGRPLSRLLTAVRGAWPEAPVAKA